MTYWSKRIWGKFPIKIWYKNISLTTYSDNYWLVITPITEENRQYYSVNDQQLQVPTKLEAAYKISKLPHKMESFILYDSDFINVNLKLESMFRTTMPNKTFLTGVPGWNFSQYYSYCTFFHTWTFLTDHSLLIRNSSAAFSFLSIIVNPSLRLKNLVAFSIDKFLYMALLLQSTNCSWFRS